MRTKNLKPSKNFEDRQAPGVMPQTNWNAVLFDQAYQNYPMITLDKYYSRNLILRDLLERMKRGERFDPTAIDGISKPSKDLR